MLDTKAIEARLAAYNRYRWYFCPRPEGHEGCLCDDCIAASNAHHEYNGHSQEDIAALLAENERLQRERSEWCDQADRRLTDYMTQQRDLLAENERLRIDNYGLEQALYKEQLYGVPDSEKAIIKNLRARLTLTPEKVEAAARALSAAYEHKYDCDPCEWDDIHPLIQNEYRAEARAALLAAGFTEAKP